MDLRALSSGLLVLNVLHASCCAQILATLRVMGREMPASSISLLRWAERAKVDVMIISDCNSVFINAMLVGESPCQHVCPHSARPLEQSLTRCH